MFYEEVKALNVFSIRLEDLHNVLLVRNTDRKQFFVSNSTVSLWTIHIHLVPFIERQ